MSALPSAPDRLPLVVPLLALGTFLMCTTEYLVAGLLPEMSSAFGVSLSRTGLLITAFAVGMIVGAPAMAIATLRLPRRATLVGALVVFAAGHVLAAITSDFAVVLAARVLTALVTGAFWSVAAVVATTAAGPASASRALGVMMSGVGLATVVGVPLGSRAGQQVGWRGAFWALAALSALAAVVVGRFARADERGDVQAVRSQLASLRSGQLWLLLGATVLVTGGYMGAFSYISPLLTEGAGLSVSFFVPLVLVGFCVGALIGTNVSGRLVDHRPVGTFLCAAVANIAVLALLALLAGSPVAAVALLVLLGVTGMAVPPVATGLAVRYASSAPTPAAALSVSAFNVGIALGSWVGGRALDSSLGASGPALIEAVGAALGLVPLLALTRAGKGAAHAEHTALTQHRETDATELAPASPPTAP
jgi:predicted MFS family arabinose efflux permease